MTRLRFCLKRSKWKPDQSCRMLGADADFIASKFDYGRLGHITILGSATQSYSGFRIRCARAPIRGLAFAGGDPIGIQVLEYVPTDSA